MTKFSSITISKDRLDLWRRRNEREQLVTTPQVLVSAIHNSTPSGPLVCVNITQDVALTDIRNMLILALQQIEATIKRGN